MCRRTAMRRGWPYHASTRRRPNDEPGSRCRIRIDGTSGRRAERSCCLGSNTPRSTAQQQLGEGCVADFIGPDSKLPQVSLAEGRADGNIRGIASARDGHTPDSPGVVARVKGMPRAAQINLNAAGKIHWRVDCRHVNVRQVTGDIAGWNIHGAAQGDRQMGQVSADTLSFAESLQCGPSGPCILISEGHMAIHKVADRLNAGPARRQLTEPAE